LPILPPISKLFKIQKHGTELLSDAEALPHAENQDKKLAHALYTARH